MNPNPPTFLHAAWAGEALPGDYGRFRGLSMLFGKFDQSEVENLGLPASAVFLGKVAPDVNGLAADFRDRDRNRNRNRIRFFAGYELPKAKAETDCDPDTDPNPESRDAKSTRSVIPLATLRKIP